MQMRRNMVDEDVLAPSVFENHFQVAFACGAILDPIQDPKTVAPRQFFNKLLQNLWLRPGLCERPPITQIPDTETLHSRKFGSNTFGETVDDLCTPPFSIKPRRDISASLPVEQDEFSIDSKSSAHLSGMNTLLDLLEKGHLAGRWL